MMHKLKLFRTQNPEVETGVPPHILSGDPQTRSWGHTTDLNGRLFTGIWEVTAGSWAVSYDEWEFCHIISGSAVLRDPLGNEIEVSAGDAFVIEPGFEGTWSVSDKVSKHYVILMP